MKVLVARVFDAISAQDPPGRFIREGSDGLMSRAQTNQKIARALREVADRAKKDEEGEGSPKPRKEPPKGEPIGELHPTDVVTGKSKQPCSTVGQDHYLILYS
jgi:hypothetical protein